MNIRVINGRTRRQCNENGSGLLSDPELQALDFLVPLSSEYPKIRAWYKTKVLSGLNNETRTIQMFFDGDDLIGLGIGKREPHERKICTVRVARSHNGRGIGLRIFDALLKWLDDDQPHLTVSESKLPQFRRLFEYYGFNLTSEHHGLYIPSKTEYGYNDYGTFRGCCLSTSDFENRNSTPPLNTKLE